MAKSRNTQGTPAVLALQRAGVPHTVHPYEVASDGSRHAYGLEAAAALGVSPERIFKTLLASCDDRLAVAVVPVSASLDLKAFASAVGAKRAVMAESADAERATGYVVGGISPLGQRKRLPTVVDASALGLATMYVSAGKRGLQVELAPADLVRLTDAKTADIARPG